MKFRHPLWADVTYSVTNEAADAWKRAGWIPLDEAPKTVGRRPKPKTVQDTDAPDATEPEE